MNGESRFDSRFGAKNLSLGNAQISSRKDAPSCAMATVAVPRKVKQPERAPRHLHLEMRLRTRGNQAVSLSGFGLFSRRVSFSSCVLHVPPKIKFFCCENGNEFSGSVKD
jgi:hypothetical protein